MGVSLRDGSNGQMDGAICSMNFRGQCKRIQGFAVQILDRKG